MCQQAAQRFAFSATFTTGTPTPVQFARINFQPQTAAVPAAVPGEAAAAARDTLGGAVAAADQLPDQLGAALLDTAREAFTQGLRLTFAISAAVAVGIAVLVAALLRHVGAGPEPSWHPDPSPGGPCAGKVGFVKASGHAAEARARS